MHPEGGWIQASGRELRRVGSAIRAAGRSVPVRLAAARLQYTPEGGVCYASPRFPDPPANRDQYAIGGAVKMTYLAEGFPHAFPRASALYVVSSVVGPGTVELAREAKRKGLKVVLNQNGVYYRAWFGAGWERLNEPLAALHELSDEVVYQSEFCRLSAVRFLGPTSAGSRVIFNPVDLNHYRPEPAPPSSKGPLRLLTIAHPTHQDYRLKTAVQTLALLSDREAQLILPGFDAADSHGRRAMDLVHAWCAELSLSLNRIVFLRPFTRTEAPGVFGSADLLLHTAVNDPSPNVVGEALAMGLPVVYSATGGVPELVGPAAGIGLPMELDWERIYPPSPEQLARAVEIVANDLRRYRAAARQRAEAVLDLTLYLSAHSRIFGVGERVAE